MRAPYLRGVFVLNRLRAQVGAVLLLGLVGLAGACGPPAERPDCFKSTGRTATEHRPLPPFTTIEVFDNVRVVLAVDQQPFGVDVTAGRNLLSEINTDIRPSDEPGAYKLVIANANRCNWVRDQTRPMTVVVHIPDSAAQRRLTLLHRGEEPVTTAAPATRLDTLFLFSTNIGDTDLDLASVYLYMGCYEYGDLRLRGHTRDLICTASGMGHVRAENLYAAYAYVDSYRYGEMHVRASQGLGMALHGPANGVWYGNAPTRALRTFDTGRISFGGE